ncbi:MAG: endo alpha-1,4 polygalactosaminidase [Puniceicoccales bacterium]
MLTYRTMVLVAIAGMLAGAVESRDLRREFQAIGSYACYYGDGMVEELGQRDLAIIEVRNQSAASIKAMQDAGTLVIGYISIGEDDELRVGDGKGPGGMDSSYFDRDRDNLPDQNSVWSSYFADARQPAWRKYFLERTAAMKEEYGVDGFFLDTVDTSELYSESSGAMASLIRDLRSQQPDSLIVLNRGFHLVTELAPVVDGVMFESFTGSYDWATQEYILLNESAWDWGLSLWGEVLRPAMEEYGTVVLALDYAASPQADQLKVAMDRAVTFGFVPEVSSIYLDEIYEIEYVPQADTRYLSVHSTPERMAYQLEIPMNGFPKGTVISPSSSYPEYEVSVVVDGVADRSGLDWRRRAWASNEKEGEHYLEFRFPDPVTANGLTVSWAWDNGAWHMARGFRIEVMNPDREGEWISVIDVENNQRAENALNFSTQEILALRLVQESGEGSVDRPHLMWVEQVELGSLN